jgi:MoxR-like ATPase
MEGTYPLPEAQRDRFMARVSMGYPDTKSEMDMLAEHAATNPLDVVQHVADAAEVSRLVDVVRSIHVAASIRQYAVDIANATRTHPDVRLGASPRATLHLVRAAKAAAALDDRDHVLPDDLQTLAGPVLAHRLILTADAQIAGRTTESVVADVIKRVAVPAAARA